MSEKRGNTQAGVSTIERMCLPSKRFGNAVNNWRAIIGCVGDLLTPASMAYLGRKADLNAGSIECRCGVAFCHSAMRVGNDAKCPPKADQHLVNGRKALVFALETSRSDVGFLVSSGLATMAGIKAHCCRSAQ